MRSVERRLERLEQTQGECGLEVWLDQEDGTFKGPDGTVLANEALAARRTPPGVRLLRIMICPRQDGR